MQDLPEGVCRRRIPGILQGQLGGPQELSRGEQPPRGPHQKTPTGVAGSTPRSTEDSSAPNLPSSHSRISPRPAGEDRVPSNRPRPPPEYLPEVSSKTTHLRCFVCVQVSGTRDRSCIQVWKCRERELRKSPHLRDPAAHPGSHCSGSPSGKDLAQARLKQQRTSQNHSGPG